MTYIHAFFLSVIEGFTEFLPVSSTGHLILAGRILHLPDTDFYKSFEIIIQLGAILAVLLLYWQKIISQKNYWPKIFVAFLPASFLGLIFYKIIKHFLMGNIFVVLTALFLGGLFFLIFEGIYQQKKDRLNKTISDLTLKESFFIGIFQSLSLVPGVSRSASSIFGGLAVGLNRKEAVEFSFLLAIPTMFAAGGYDIFRNYDVILGSNLKILAFGFIGAFLTALFAVKLFIKYVQNHNFIIFGIYRILLAIILWIFIF